MAKADDIVRLRNLAARLGREADISGSAAEIRQRVAELEEEIAAGDGQGVDDGGSEPLITETEKAAVIEMASSHRRVIMRRTVHASGRHPETGCPLELLICGETALVTPACRDALLGAELAADA
ncbi:DNA-packaging protein FI [Klebsiella pneumoniae]|uniref:DNA-packaging protein FI n=1 Tax=Klebsiella pneumoniae TaxID=573 RepID=UPI002FF28FF4